MHEEIYVRNLHSRTGSVLIASHLHLSKSLDSIYTCISIVNLKISLITKELRFAVRPRFNDPSYRLSTVVSSKQRRPGVTSALSACKRYWAVVTRSSGVLLVPYFVCELCPSTKVFLAAFAPLEFWMWNKVWRQNFIILPDWESVRHTQAGPRIIKSMFRCGLR
jgi:hypothetical protein